MNLLPLPVLRERAGVRVRAGVDPTNRSPLTLILSQREREPGEVCSISLSVNRGKLQQHAHLRASSQSTSTPRPGRGSIAVTGPRIKSGSFTSENSW